MIAFIAPYTKTPRHIDGFDYLVPKELEADVQPGSIVRIPLRRSLVDGIVLSIKNEATFSQRDQKKLKSLEAVLPFTIWHSPKRIAFLQWFAQEYSISLPTAWKTMQYPFPRRVSSKNRDLLLDEPTTASTTPLSLKRYDTTLPKDTTEGVILFQSREEQYGFYQSLIESQPDRPVVIITPESYRTNMIVGAITSIATKQKRPLLNVSASSRPRAWHALQQSVIADAQQKDSLHTSTPAPIVVGSKKLLFLELPATSIVVIDDEHEKAHKQYDANPRYRSTRVAEYLAQTGSATVYYTSYAPSLALWKRHTQEKLPLINLRDSKNLSSPSIVDMQHLRSKEHPGWLSEEAVDAIRSNGRVLLFLNRMGKNIASVCKDCGHLLSASDLQCPQCGGTLIRIEKKGIQQLTAEFAELFPEKKFLRIDSDTADQERLKTSESIEQASVVIGTEKIFRLPALYTKPFDAVIVLSIDHLLLYPHYSSQERVFQILRGLQLITHSLIIQTYAPHLPIFHALLNGDVDGFLQQEYAVRSMLKLPPAQDYWIAKNLRTGQSIQLERKEDIQQQPPEMIIDHIDR